MSLPATTVVADAGGSATSFPPHLARELRASSVHPLPHGTSPARVWRVVTPDGDLAVKVLQQGAGIADGQDIDSFLREPAQIRRVHHEVPAIGALYVDVLGQWQRPGWAAYAMPYVAGSPAVAPATARGDARDRLHRVFTSLTEHGYARSRRHAATTLRPPELALVRKRLWILQRHVPRELLDGPPVRINGRVCRPLVPLLQSIERDAGLLRKLWPRLVSYPVHGELDLADLLASGPGGGRFTLLDPRGTRGYGDPVDDFAHVLFSMTVLDRAVADGVRTWHTARTDGKPASWVLRSVGPHRGYPQLGEWFVGMLGRLPFGAELSRVDPHWRLRLAFAHGFHALVEATARLSERNPPPRPAWAPGPEALATTFVALRLRLLEQAVAGAGGRAGRDGELPDVSTGLDDDTGVVWRYGDGRRR